MKKRIDAIQDELGFTLIEVMVAISVLLIGVLGAVTMLNTANAATDRNQSRNSATNLVRDILEASRAIPYGDARPTTTSSGVADPTLQNALQSMKPLSGQSSLSDAQATTTGWQIIRRGVTYDVTLRACVVDDVKDKVATPHTPAADDGGGYYCPGLSATPTGDADPDDYRRVKATASWTRSGQVFSVSQTAVIINPTGGLGPAPVGGIGGSVNQTCPVTRSLNATFRDTAVGAVFTVNDPGSTQVTVTTPSSTDATAKTKTYTFTYSPSSTPPDNSYTVTAYAFNDVSQPGRQILGTLVVNCVEPSAPTGLTGGFDWRRCTLYPATCNPGERIVDLEWNPNPEADVVGYAVWRVNGAADFTGDVSSPDTRLTCVGTSTPTDHPGPADFFESVHPTCWDTTAPGQPSLPGSVAGLVTLNGTVAKYWIQALDPDPADATGATLRSTSSVPALTNHSTVLTVTENLLNVRPTAPILTVTNAGGSPCLSWTNSIDLDALGVNLGAGAIRFYRIYRDGSPVGLVDIGGGVQVNDVPYADRIGRSAPNQPNSCDTTNPSRSWGLDTSSGTANWHYWVTAVDQNYLESYPSNDAPWTAP